MDVAAFKQLFTHLCGVFDAVIHDGSGVIFHWSQFVQQPLWYLYAGLPFQLPQ